MRKRGGRGREREEEKERMDRERKSEKERGERGRKRGERKGERQREEEDDESGIKEEGNKINEEDTVLLFKKQTRKPVAAIHNG